MLFLESMYERKKKHMKKKLLFLLTTILATIGMATMVSAANTFEKDVPINVYDSIMLTDSSSVPLTFEWDKSEGNGDSIYKLKFTLDKAAYVKVKIYSTVGQKASVSPALGCLGKITVTNQSGSVVKELTNMLERNATLTKQLALEKGTYYIVYNGRWFGKTYSGVGDVSTTVDVQYISRTGNVLGNSTKNAINVSNNKVSTGIVSNIYTEQYFKFTLNQQSNVNFNLSVTNTPSGFDRGINYEIISANGISYTEKLEKQNHLTYPASHAYQVGKNYADSCNTGKLTLPKGTYYLKVKAVKDGFVSTVSVKPSIAKILPTLKTPKLKKYKKNTKKITGTATKGAKVKVKVGKKTYTVKANSKGKFTVKLKSKLKKKTKITIYATKKGYKNSKKKTYKVK